MSVTVPVDGLPPITALGDTDTLLRPTGFIVSVAVLVTPESLAQIVEVVEVETEVVLTVNVVDVAPPTIVT